MRSTIDFGIYLGQDNSCVAVLDGRNVVIVKNSIGDELTPCTVYEKKVGDSVVKRVGKTAKLKLIDKHEHGAMEFRNKMGLKEWHLEFPSTGRKATAADLSADVLSELIESVKQKTGEDMSTAVIAVPAAFLTPMYEDTKKAGKLAGLDYVELLEEPVAAALAYGLSTKSSSTEKWLAYDLGGGTFDAALVKVEDGIFSIFDHEGLRNLGGKDLDAAIVEEFFIPNLLSITKKGVIPHKSSSWYQLKAIAEEAKCALSTTDKYTVEADNIDGHDFLYTITRDKLDELEAKVFAPTIEKCKELLARNKFTSNNDVEKIILIGGATLSPNLRKIIETELQIAVDFSVDPLTAVARGAAIYAAGRRIPDEVLYKIREKIDM